MTATENLQDRVTFAIDRLKRSQVERRRQNKSLSAVLADLETKFSARETELDHCRERIAGLESSNASLSGLLAELVDVVERVADDTAHDPVYRLTAGARDVLGIASEPGDTGGPGDGTDGGSRSPLTEPQAAPTLHDFTVIDGGYEDVDDDDLRAETLLERLEGADSFPRLVTAAIASAGGGTDDADDAEDDDGIDIPDPAAEAPTRSASPFQDDSNLDIREIMARLEIAAERAQVRADADAYVSGADLDRTISATG